MSETFYRKYRPQTFADVVGQKHIVRTLQNALSLGRVGQAYLFTGPRGTGKTTLARILAKAVNCLNRKKNAKKDNSEPCGQCPHCLLMAEGRSMDVIEIDAASHTGVDNIRELRETVALPPTVGSHKIYIIDEVHMLSAGAFNALLKTLEEPPAHVIFILATTALHKVPDTIVSRTQAFALGRFPIESIVAKLEHIAKAEKIKADPEALEMMALSAEGGMRDAESLFMQVANLADGRVSAEIVTEVLGTTKKESFFALLELISERKLSESLKFVRNLASDGRDLAIFCGGFLQTLRDLLFLCVQREKDPSLLEGYIQEHAQKLAGLAGSFTPDETARMLEYIQVATRDTKTAFIEELPLEIAIVKILSDTNKTNDHPNDPNKRNQSTVVGQPSVNTSQPQPKQSLVSQESAPDKGEAAKSISEESIREKWPRILDEVKRRNASLSVALSQARLMGTENSVIVLSVKYTFHKERLEDRGYQETLTQAFDSILNASVRFRIVLEEAKTEKESSTPPSPLLNQALEMLGGRIVTES